MPEAEGVVRAQGFGCVVPESACPEVVGSGMSNVDVSELRSLRASLKAMAAGMVPAWLRTRVDDSDLVQETLLKAVQYVRRASDQTSSDYEAMLKQILRNTITDSVRHHLRQQRSLLREQELELEKVYSADPTASELVRQAETRELLLQAIQQLPADYQTVLMLRQQSELTFGEIGYRMQRSSDAVRMLWGRAVVALGERLSGAGNLRTIGLRKSDNVDG